MHLHRSRLTHRSPTERPAAPGRPGAVARLRARGTSSYDDPTSTQSQRLGVVQRWIRAALDDGATTRRQRVRRRRARPARRAARRDDVRGRLVELDPTLAARARAAAPAGIEVVEADAGTTDAYAGAVPADLVLLCGVFGNIADDDVEATVRPSPMLCAPARRSIWTRHRRPPDLTPDDPAVVRRGRLRRGGLRGRARSAVGVAALRRPAGAVRARPPAVHLRHLRQGPAAVPSASGPPSTAWTSSTVSA